MASFSDEIQKFNPYIEQLPVDDFIQVGMTKQSQWQTGVDQVQAAITSVAGLDVPEKYKGYVQSALYAMRDGVKNVISGDFSDNQLVQQLTGAAQSIISDKIVQAGVKSAAHYRTQDELRKAAQKEGKSSINNDRWLDEQYAAWAQDGDLSQSFQGQYVQYTDLGKKWMDLVKTLDPDGRLEQLPFVTKADGTMDFEAIGDAMVERGIEGKSKEKIMNAIRATLTPNDMQQLQIDAHFTFQGVTPERLVEKATKDFEAEVASLTKHLDAQRKKRKLLDAKDARVEQLDEEIKAIEEALGSEGKTGTLYSSFKQDVASIHQDPEGAKTRLYMNSFIKQFAYGFSSEKVTQKYVQSPMREQQNWFLDYNEKVRMNNETIRKNKADEAAAAEKEARDKAEKEGGGTPASTDLDVPTADTNSPAQAFLTENATLAQNFNTELDDLARKLVPLGGTDTEVVAQKAVIQQAIADFRQKGTIPDGNYGQMIVKLAEQQQQMEGRQTLMRKVEATVDEQLGGNNAFTKALSTHNNLTIGSTTFTPKEVYDYIRKEVYVANPQGPGHTTINLRKLSAKERILYEQVAKARYSTSRPDADHKVNAYLDSYQNVKRADADYSRKKQEAMDKILSPRLARFKPVLSAAPLLDGKLTEKALGAVNLYIQKARDGGMRNGGFNPDEVETMISGDGSEKTRVMIQAQGDAYQLLVSQDGKSTQRIDISRQDVIKNFGEQYVTKHGDILTNLDLGNGNTNLTGEPSASFFGRNTLKAVKGLNVGADLEQALDGSGYYINFNVKTPEGWKHFKTPKPLASIDHALQTMSMISDAALWKEMIERRPSLAEKYELDKNNQIVPKKQQ